MKPKHLVLLILGLGIVAVATTAALRSLPLSTSAAPASAQISTTPVPTPTPTTTPTPIPAFTDLYRNTTEGFSLTLPAGWVAEETGGRTPALRVRNPPGDEYLLAEVYGYRLLDPPPVGEWLMGQVASYGEVQVTSESPVLLGPDTAGYRALLSWRTDTDLEVREQWTGVVRGTQAFLIRVQMLESGYQGLLGAIDAFSSSFTPETPAPFGASRNDSLFRWGGQILTLDPALFRGGPAGIPGAIFSGLVTLDRSSEVVPDIAKDWDVTGDGTVYTFHLRPDVVFHDGRQVTAHDFKYSWERAADPATESRTARTYLGDVVGVKEKLDAEATEIVGLQVLDKLTLQVTIDSPKAYFIQKLVYPTAYVVDRSNVETGDNWTGHRRKPLRSRVLWRRCPPSGPQHYAAARRPVHRHRPGQR